MTDSPPWVLHHGDCLELLKSMDAESMDSIVTDPPAGIGFMSSKGRAYGPIPEGYEVHHRNHNGADNRLDNFELVTVAWHDNYHQREREDHRILDGVEQRRCQRCQEYKPLSCFKRRKAGTYQGYCESCALEYLRAWREANREHHNAYMRAYRKRKSQ